MEQWISNWLEEQRNKGIRGYEIKKSYKSYYVYKSTTIWNKETKKRDKSSTYIGKLDKENGLIIESSKKIITQCKVERIKQYGNAALLNIAMKDLQNPLKEVFGDVWEEIYALALVRVTGYVPLKRVESVWERLYNITEISPSLNPKNLSSILKEIGLDRTKQDRIFESLSKTEEQLIYDLSVVFSRSEGINFAEKGVNKDKIHIPQVNLALLCSANDGLPTMIRAIPGSVRDITSLYKSIQEIGLEGKTLILDRGFYSDDLMKFLVGKHLSFIIPARRNSTLYDYLITLNRHFFYRDRLIKCGKRKISDFYVYLFEDASMKVEEENTLYKLFEKNKINKIELDEDIEKAGCILIVSDLDIEAKEIFLLYKKRDGVEKLFDIYKTTLNADILYLQDNESVFGHLFVSFLSLYGYCKLENILRKSALIDKFSPLDLLEYYSKVYKMSFDGRDFISEVPKKVHDLDKALGLKLFPK
jgi:transposase